MMGATISGPYGIVYYSLSYSEFFHRDKDGQYAPQHAEHSYDRVVAEPLFQLALLVKTGWVARVIPDLHRLPDGGLSFLYDALQAVMAAFGIEFQNGTPIGVHIASMPMARALPIPDVLDHLGSGDGGLCFLPLARFTDTVNAGIGEEPAGKGDDGVNDQLVQY